MIEFDTWMKLNNAIIRHMTVLLDSEPELYVRRKDRRKRQKKRQKKRKDRQKKRQKKR